MGRTSFICVCISTQLILIGLQIHRQTRSISRTYLLQKYEREREQVRCKKQEMARIVCSLSGYDAIKKYAQEKLHMQQITFNQIKRIAS